MTVEQDTWQVTWSNQAGDQNISQLKFPKGTNAFAVRSQARLQLKLNGIKFHCKKQ